MKVIEMNTLKSNQLIKNILILLILFFSVHSLQSQVRIKMKKENGVYTTPCIVNGLKLRFIFDTGASNVSISLSEAIFMLKNGYLNEDDLHGSSYSEIANGDVIENTTVTIRTLEIGGLKLYNIEAIIIHELTAPLLLGQSAIQKLGRIQLEKDELIIVSAKSLSTEDMHTETISLIKKAEGLYFDKSFYLAADLYQKAYDLSPATFICWDFYLMGCSYASCDNSLLTIEYLEKATDCLTDKTLLYYSYSEIGDSYSELGNQNQAAINLGRALSYASDNQKTFCYLDLGRINYIRGNYYKAIDYFEQSINYYATYNKPSDDDDDGLNTLKGEIFMRIGKCYAELNRITKVKQYLSASASLGYEPAIELCKETGLHYNSATKKKKNKRN